jgi:hypothetical protein
MGKKLKRKDWEKKETGDLSSVDPYKTEEDRKEGDLYLKYGFLCTEV